VKQRPFLALWTIAVIATVTAFVVHLALRGRTVDLGYKLGRARAEQARLREVKRVLSLEAASYETPQRVEMVARTLLGMTPPPPERVIALRGPVPMAPPEDQGGDEPAAPAPAGSASAGPPGASASGAVAAAPSAAAPAPATPGVILPRGTP
jgi:cell division protein FtsL